MLPIRIIIADDHPVFRQGLASLFFGQPAYTIVAEAGNGIQLLEMLADIPVDVVLLDLEMPGLNGLEVLEKIHVAYQELKVVVLSSHTEPRIVAEVAKLGGDGYLHKMSQWEDIEKALAAVQHGGKYFPPFHNDDDAASPTAGDKPRHPIPPSVFVRIQRLTPTELAVIPLIATGLTSGEIAPLLNITSNTVDTHRRNILQKLEQPTATALVAFAFRYGLIR